MRYQTFLKAGLWSIILLFILSLACTAVTVHYWIIGDWLMSRGVEIAGVSTAGMLVVDHAILILYIDDDTNATIISACLGLLAGIVGFIAWYKLRRTDMDADHQLSRRRFWVGFVFLTTTACFCSALAALVLHYTKKGPDEFGCTPEDNARGDRLMSCTRERGACNVLPFLRRQWEGAEGRKWDKPYYIPLACNEARAMKWMQIVLMLVSILILAMFGTQAWLRKNTRYERVGGLRGKEVARSDSPPALVSNPRLPQV